MHIYSYIYYDTVNYYIENKIELSKETELPFGAKLI